MLAKVSFHLVPAIPIFPPIVKLCRRDALKHALNFPTFTPHWHGLASPIMWLSLGNYHWSCQVTIRACPLRVIWYQRHKVWIFCSQKKLNCQRILELRGCVHPSPLSNGSSSSRPSAQNVEVVKCNLADEFFQVTSLMCSNSISKWARDQVSCFQPWSA